MCLSRKPQQTSCSMCVGSFAWRELAQRSKASPRTRRVGNEVLIPRLDKAVPSGTFRSPFWLKPFPSLKPSVFRCHPAHPATVFSCLLPGAAAGVLVYRHRHPSLNILEGAAPAASLAPLGFFMHAVAAKKRSKNWWVMSGGWSWLKVARRNH